jgi:transposase
MAFSIDLRERVIAAIDEGQRVTDVSKLFKVCKRVIYNWLNLREETNSLAPKSGYQKGHSHKITDWEKFRNFAENNQHCTVNQMIAKWAELTGITMSDSVMERALHKINYTSKKKLWVTLKPTKKNVKNF